MVFKSTKICIYRSWSLKVKRPLKVVEPSVALAVMVTQSRANLKLRSCCSSLVHLIVTVSKDADSTASQDQSSNHFHGAGVSACAAGVSLAAVCHHQDSTECC